MKIPKEILDEIRKNLERESDKIRKTLSSLKLQDPFSNPDRLTDNAASDTEASEESSHERVEALEKELNQHLDEIQEAISRIIKGKYGQCQSCYEFIDTDRLAAKPTALYCVTCEKKKE